MKFRFLGDGDCPDWLLSEINTLSRMTSIKMKLLGQLVAKSLTDGNLDISEVMQQVFEEIARQFFQPDFEHDCLAEDRVKKITQDAKLETGDAKAIVAALNLIFSSSTSHAVSATDLSSELQQLGLPREHSTTLARLYTEHSPQITGTLTGQSLRLKRLTSIDTLENESSSPFVKLRMNTDDIDGKQETNCLTIPKAEIPVLLAELKRARTLMEGL